MTDTTPASLAPPSGPRGGSNNANRRRGRGGNSNTNGGSHTDSFRGRSRGGGRRGGRGGGNGPGQYTAASDLSTKSPAAEPEPPGPNSGGTSGGRLTGGASTIKGESKGKDGEQAEAEEEEDGEVCFICASDVAHTSVSPCNHRSCHICALRLRALYKNKACAHCRTEASFVIFTDDPNKRFEDFGTGDFTRTDENLGIRYEKDEIFEDTVLLLRYNCPDKDCDVACLGWPDLHRHVKSQHGKVMCDLCTRNKKVFTHEHELFTVNQLRKHEKHGDDNPGAIDQSGFKGHPECGFCKQRFYGDDELYVHCREKHERCHICDRQSGGRSQQYYLNYEALEEHFRKDHFLCYDKECLEKKFVVFDSQLDLKAHQLEAHPNGMSKDVRRDARVVDINSFDYRTPYQNPNNRNRRGAGRGRDPNAEPLPASSAQPMRRDELAYQRQMAIQSAQSVSTRTFGGQLTAPPTQTARAPAPANGRPAASTPASTPAPASSSSTAPTNAFSLLTVNDDPLAAVSPQDQARRLRHTAVIERASNFLGHEPQKINTFRTQVSRYQNSVLTATNLIDAFFTLFDTSSTELGTLIKELAELYESENKRNNLLKAWNDWRAINEDYPALPGPDGLLPGMSAGTVGNSGSGGSRVLRLKSSTAQSGRSVVGGGTSWGGSSSSNPKRNGASNSTASSAFPPLSASGSGKNKKPATIWGGPSSSSTTTSTHATPSSSRAASRVPASRAPLGGTEAFPGLPPAPKPNVLMAGLTRGTVRWGENKPAANAWGGGSSGGQSSSSQNQAVEEEAFGAETGKGKGKGKKKQVLYHFG